MLSKISDDTALMLGGLGCAGWAASSLAKPGFANKILYGSEGDGPMTAMTNYFGCGMGLNAANAIMMARDSGCPTKTKKDVLKASGTAWLVAAGVGAYHTNKGNIKKEAGWANAAACAGLGALLLAKGRCSKVEL
ncbi:hypothetical protein FOA52_008556 [Chlamydomonas sp. UWO 241]|nr:hypothetical protein FOA52_008556 [Chlamydomonas sp. UWO 241]